MVKIKCYTNNSEVLTNRHHFDTLRKDLGLERLDVEIWELREDGQYKLKCCILLGGEGGNKQEQIIKMWDWKRAIKTMKQNKLEKKQ